MLRLWARLTLAMALGLGLGRATLAGDDPGPQLTSDLHPAIAKAFRHIDGLNIDRARKDDLKQAAALTILQNTDKAWIFVPKYTYRTEFRTQNRNRRHEIPASFLSKSDSEKYELLGMITTEPGELHAFLLEVAFLSIGADAIDDARVKLACILANAALTQANRGGDSPEDFLNWVHSEFPQFAEALPHAQYLVRKVELGTIKRNTLSKRATRYLKQAGLALTLSTPVAIVASGGKAIAADSSRSVEAPSAVRPTYASSTSTPVNDAVSPSAKDEDSWGLWPWTIILAVITVIAFIMQLKPGDGNAPNHVYTPKPTPPPAPPVLPTIYITVPYARDRQYAREEMYV